MPNPNCARCGTLKENRGYTTSYCLPCGTQLRKAWGEANPERVKAAQARHRKSPQHREATLKYRAERKIKRKTDAAFRAKEHAYDRKYRLKALYGLTLPTFHAMHAAQNDVCAICNQPETNARIKSRVPSGAKTLSVDHDHTTGVIRALLCYRCNVSIGRVKEDPELLRQMITYLVKHRA